MSHWSNRRSRRWALEALAAIAIAAGACASCGDDGASSSGAGTGPGGSASVTVSVTSSVSTGGGGGSSCPQPPAYVPAGWERPPGAPCDCNVFMAPTAAVANPPSPWLDCGPGCLELEADWTVDDSARLYALGGAAADGYRYVAYRRFLTAQGPYETQIVRLPDNVVVLDTFSTFDTPPSWNFGPMRLSRHGHLLEAFGPDAGGEHEDLWYVLPANGLAENQPPQLTMHSSNSWGPYEAAISSELWAVTFQGAGAWGWHDMTPSSELPIGWSSMDGRIGFGPEAVGRHIFFSTWSSSLSSEIMVWSEIAGAQPYLSHSSKSAGGSCCLETDGTEMVWFEASNYQGGEIYGQVELMASPLATDPQNLQPRVLRPAFQQGVIAGGGEIGGGYALHGEARAGGIIKHILTRLSDGYYWVIAPRPGRAWHVPLYVDDAELALVESNTDFQGFQRGHWTIVRLSIASLGAPLPPGSGF